MLLNVFYKDLLVLEKWLWLTYGRLVVINVNAYLPDIYVHPIRETFFKIVTLYYF